MRNGLFAIRLFLLGTWVGAMAGFAFLFAPAAFHFIGPVPAFAELIATSVRAIAGVGFVAGSAALLITVFVPGAPARMRLFIALSLVVAFIAQFGETQFIVPTMEKTTLLTPAYDTLHRSSSAVFSVVLIAATIAFFASCRPTYR